MVRYLLIECERELDDTYAPAAVIIWSGTYDDKPAVDVNKVVDREMSQYDYLAEIERRARRYLCCRSSY